MRAGTLQSVAMLGAVVLTGYITFQVIRGGRKLGEAVSDAGGAAAVLASKVVDSINPANPDNVVAKSVNAVVQTATGEPDVSLGTKLWEWFNPDKVAAEAAITAPSNISGTQKKALMQIDQWDRDDAELGAMMRAAVYGGSVDQEDADLGVAMTEAQGPYLDFSKLMRGMRR